MTEKFLSAVSRCNMLKAGDTVTVALSGGADSSALLHILLSHSDELGIKVRAAHLNHNLRGAESDRDERFVRDMCERWGIELFVKSVRVSAMARESGDSIELAARKARYSFFEEIGGIIATAHTASDNAETVLLNITRGTGIKGIAGIPAVRGRYIRPLGLCSREDIERYCKEHGVSFVTDSTNLTDDYTRNKIRHGVMTTLRNINPAIENAVLRLSHSAAEDSDFIEKCARDYFNRNFRDGKIYIGEDMHPALVSRVLSSFLLETTGFSSDYAHITEIREALGQRKRLSVSGGFEVEVDRFEIGVYGFRDQKTVYEVKKRVLSKENFEKELKINKLLLKNAIDCDKITDNVTIRTRCEGDSIKLCGRGTKSLKKLYNEEKIPLSEREGLPLAADSSGVVWICGIGVSQRVRIDRTTKTIMVFDVIKQ